MTMEPLITRLVQQAPELDPHTIDELVAALEQAGTPLALAIRRIVELVAEQLVDMAIALPALAEAIATLESSRDPKVLEAARFQIDTLEPVPDRPTIAGPDVPLDALRRR
ncbi:MAG: hypothetical protein ACM31C_20010 [Acidobacteriota bacterium]